MNAVLSVPSRTSLSQVLLPYGNVTEVTKLVLDGTESTAFTFDDVSQIISINAPYATARIEFNAGYETLPVVVKQAVLVMINTAFNNRDDVASHSQSDRRPHRHDCYIEYPRLLKQLV